MPENDNRLSLEIEAIHAELRRLAASYLRR